MANYSSIHQYEPLRAPSNWSSEERQLVKQLGDVIDDLYSRFNRLRMEDLGKSLQGKITDALGNSTEVKQTAESLMLTVSGGSKIYRQDAEPADALYGDLWYDTDDDNRLYRRVGGQWQLMVAFENILDSLTIKNATPPPNPTENTLWLDTSVTPNVMKRWTGSTWQPLTSRTFASPTKPSGGNIGDLWINIADGNKWYRCEGGDNWIAYQDQTIPELTDTIENMILAISGGSHVFHQPDQPSAGMGHGDLWYDTDDNNKCYRFIDATVGWESLDFTNTIDTINSVSQSIMTPEQIVNTVTSTQVFADKADKAELSDYATNQSVTDKFTTEVAQRAEDIRIAVKQETDRAAATEGTLSSYQQTLQKYFVFDAAGFHIINPASQFNTLLSEDRLGFRFGNFEVAYIGQNSMYITVAAIGNTLTIGTPYAAGQGGTGLTEIKAEYGGISATWRAK